MNRNIWTLTGLSILWSIQCLTVLVWVYQFIPIPHNPIVDGLYPANLSSVHPERDVFFYRIFVVMTLGIFAALFMCLRPSLKGRGLNPAWETLFKFECLLTFVQLSTVFKILVYVHHELAVYAFYVITALVLLSKIFWPELHKILVKVGTELSDGHAPDKYARWLGWIFPGVIFLIIWVPDYQAAVARMFFGEQFHHTNAFIMAPGWSHLMGNILNVDTIARYGEGAPIVISELAKLLGGYSYESVFIVVMLGVIGYFIAWYFLFRAWFGSIAWAVIGILLAIRMQLFQAESLPFIFTYPNVSPIRCVCDVFMFACLYQHAQGKGRAWLYACGVLCGFAIFYTTGDGLYLTAAFLGYVIIQLLSLNLRTEMMRGASVATPISLFFLPLISAFGFFWIATGPEVFHATFWKNSTEFINYYTSGFGVTPIFQSLQSGNYFESFIGLGLPVFYLVTLIFIVASFMMGLLDRKNLFAAAIAMYGLGAYQYYAALSNNTSYYRNAIAIAFLVCWWGYVLLKKVPKAHVVKVVGLTLALYALVTNHNFIAYPNIFNVSRNPVLDPLVAPIPAGRQGYFNHLFIEYPDQFKLPLNSLGEKNELLVTEKDFKDQQALKALYRQEMDYSKDAALIQSLTSPTEKVAVVSSFETQILIQSKRRPFFYFFELINSRPRRMRIFVVTHLFTHANVEKTIAQLEQEKPPYVFMERIFLTESVPRAYLYDSADFIPVLEYIRTKYESYKTGEFLVAMKRKD